jgi:phosphatidylglycerol:prolipoprotein diacylglycerol transferase
VPLELAFNGVALIVFALVRNRVKQRGQLFHAYLIAYGLFRFAHEFRRETPPLVAGISGYQIAALGCVVLGVWRMAARRREQGTAGKMDAA